MWLILRSAAFVVVMPGTVAGYLPYLIVSSTSHRRLGPDPITAAGAALGLLGAIVLLWCVLGFLVEGRGTLAPIDPPRRLVTGRLYQHVRNPMYVGLLTLLAGEAVGFGSIDLIAYAVAVAACVHLFVIGYEEPSLHRRFGAAYDQYRQAVPRWIPRPRSASPSR